MKRVPDIERKETVIFLAVISTILWGSAFPVLKTTYSDMGLAPLDIGAKMVLAGIRFFFAGWILVVFSIFNKNHSPIEKKNILYLFILGLLQTTLQYFFFYNGLANTSGIKGAVLASSGVFFTPLLAHFVYHNDRLTLKKQGGLTLGFLGIIIINWERKLNFDFTLLGEGFLIFSGIVSAAGNIVAKRVTQQNHPFLVSGWQMISGSVILFLIGHTITPAENLNFTVLSVGLLVYSSFLSAIAFGIWYLLLKHHKPGEVSLFKFLVPVFGSLLSVFFLPEETFSLRFLFALVLVSAGIFIIYFQPKKK